MRILIVEDDETTARALQKGLAAEGFAVVHAASGEAGFYELSVGRFDVVILDWMLPGRDGPEVLRTARSKGIPTPVLLLTARDDVADRVLGLESGADDYLVKPFAFAELFARVRTLLRRAPAAEPLRRCTADLVVDLETRRVWRADRPVELTPREFDLLACLVREAGRVVPRETLAREVWRETNRATPLDNVIDVHVGNLRRKIDAGHATTLIQTVRGIGFVVREQPRE